MYAFYCLEKGIAHRWLAAKTTSEQLAFKPGFTKGETYETLENQQRKQGSAVTSRW